MAENNTEMVLEPEDFGELTLETKEGKKYIACGEISEEGLNELNDVVAESLEALDGAASVSVADVIYGITLNNGKYESMDMTCVYSVTVAGETCNLTFELSLEFSYDNIARITAPANADEYEEVDFGDLMG